MKITRLPPGIAAGAYRYGEPRPKATGVHRKFKQQPKKKRKPPQRRQARDHDGIRLAKIMGEML